MDIRRRLTDYDRQMMRLPKRSACPFTYCLTKADKLKRGQAATAVLQVRKEVAGRATVQAFSATERVGEERGTDRSWPSSWLTGQQKKTRGTRVPGE